jgi:regulator of cell morphogenesis and NO signaling
MFTLTQKLSDIIHHDHRLLPILNRFGIRLGFGDQSVVEVCKSNNINAEFFIEIVNTYHDPDYFPRERFLDFPLPLIVEYLKKTHQYYYTFYIPEIEKQLNELIASAPEQNNLSLLTRFYLKFKQELHEHLQYEDKFTFPYVLELHKLHLQGKRVTDLESLTVKSIVEFEETHSDVDSKLMDLKNIIIKYLNASYDDNKCNTLVTTIFNFEDDLRDHSRIEDKIMVPKVLRIEKILFPS